MRRGRRPTLGTYSRKPRQYVDPLENGPDRSLSVAPVASKIQILVISLGSSRNSCFTHADPQCSIPSDSSTGGRGASLLARTSPISTDADAAG